MYLDFILQLCDGGSGDGGSGAEGSGARGNGAGGSGAGACCALLHLNGLLVQLLLGCLGVCLLLLLHQRKRLQR